MRVFYFGFTFIIAIYLLSCKSSNNSSKNQWDGTQQIEIKYAKGFAIQKKDGVTRLQIFRPSQYSVDTLEYWLVPEGKEATILQHVIRFPVQSFVINSSTHAALLRFCGLDDKVIGVSQPEYVCNETIHRNLQAGIAKNAGTYAALDEETILALHPDLILAVGFDSEKLKSYQRMEQMGIPSLVISEWLETHPLGRLEWVKLLGALSGKLNETIASFNEVEKQYLKYVKLAQNIPEKEKPDVMTALPFKDIWHMPGGNSFMCQLMEDAGGKYVYRDKKKDGSLPLDFETVLARCQKTKIWLVNGAVKSKPEVLEMNERFRFFKAFQTGNMYNNDALQCERTGSNLFWENGTIEPHTLLGDYIKIFHPHLLPNYTLKYHRKL